MVVTEFADAMLTVHLGAGEGRRETDERVT